MVDDSDAATQAAHWQAVYAEKDPSTVSWFEARPERSLRLIRDCPLAPHDAIIDVGAGASRLADCLLAAGYKRLTLVDIAASALEVTRARLATVGCAAELLVGDITHVQLPGRYRLWHDRAVFHFLTQAEDQQAYRAQLFRSLEPGGWLVLAAFSADGPTQCSGLPVRRYRVEEWDAFLGAEFTRETAAIEDHVTPGGRVQSFLYARFRRRLPLLAAP